MADQGDIGVKGAAGADLSPCREIADQPSPLPTAWGREAAAVHGAAHSTEKLEKRPLSSRSLHFFVVTLLFALGIGLLWLTTSAYTNNEGFQRLQQFEPFWSVTTKVACVVALGILFSGIARHTALYPLVIFLVSLEAIQQISMVIINNGEQLFLDVKRIFNVDDLTFFMFISGLYTLFFAAATALIGGSRAGTTVAEDIRRRRIRAYFERRPIWPWVVSGLAVFLILFSIIAEYPSRQWLFFTWVQMIIGSAFSVSALWLLAADKKRQPLYYFMLFIVLFSVGSDLLNYLIGFPYALPVKPTFPR